MVVILLMTAELNDQQRLGMVRHVASMMGLSPFFSLLLRKPFDIHLSLRALYICSIIKAPGHFSFLLWAVFISCGPGLLWERSGRARDVLGVVGG